MKSTCIFACCLALMFCHVSKTQADFLVNGFGLSSPGQTIGFDELGLAFDTPVTNQYDGVSFSSGVFQMPEDLSNFGPFNIDENYVGNFSNITNEQSNPFSIFFDDNVDSAAFAIITNPGVTEFTALLDGIVVDTNTAITQIVDPNNFFGFEGIVFDEIQIFVDPATNGAAGIDNLQFNSVPEPSTSFACAVMASTVLVRRRRD